MPKKLEKIPSKGRKDHTKSFQDTARQFHSSTALSAAISSNLIKIAILKDILELGLLEIKTYS